MMIPYSDTKKHGAVEISKEQVCRDCVEEWGHPDNCIDCPDGPCAIEQDQTELQALRAKVRELEEENERLRRVPFDRGPDGEPNGPDLGAYLDLEAANAKLRTELKELEEERETQKITKHLRERLVKDGRLEPDEEYKDKKELQEENAKLREELSRVREAVCDKITEILVLSYCEKEWGGMGETADEILSFRKRAIEAYQGKWGNTSIKPRVIFNELHARVNRDCALIIRAIEEQPKQALALDSPNTKGGEAA